MTPRILQAVDQKLLGWPDRVLTFVLLIIAVLVVIVALRGKPYAKAFVATWLLAP
jgi:hypothetical protein